MATSLGTRAELLTAAASWYANRTDLPTENLLALAEARLNRLLKLRTIETDSALTGTIGVRTIALPATFKGEPIALFLNRSGVGREEMVFVPSDMDTSTSNGEPRYWTIDGTNVAFERPCDQAYSFTLKHLAKGLTLAAGASGDTNALLTNHPDVYLFACQYEAAKYVRDFEKAQAWLSELTEVVQQINLQDHRSRALATLRVDPALQPSAMRRGTGFNIYTGS